MSLICHCCCKYLHFVTVSRDIRYVNCDFFFLLVTTREPGLSFICVYL
jgi:hypothetical protein